MEPRQLFNPFVNESLTFPKNWLPDMDADESEFVRVFQDTEWGKKILTSAASYDVSMMNRDRYLYLQAKDVLSLYSRTPRCNREKLVDVLCKHGLIVKEVKMDETSLPYKLRTRKLTEFAYPIFSCQHRPLEQNVVYVYTKGSVSNPSKSSNTYSGWSYVLVHNGVIVDEGIGKGHTTNRKGLSPHYVQVSGMHLGLLAAFTYLAHMSVTDKKQVRYVCVRADCKTAIAQARGSSNTDDKDKLVEEVLWNIHCLMNHFEDIRFERIPRELNQVADFLASEARDSQRTGQKVSFSEAKYKGLCDSMLQGDVKVGFKVKSSDDPVVE